MNVSNFLESFAKILEIKSQDLKDDFVLSQLPTWDSLSFLAIISLIHQHFKVEIEGRVLSRCQTLSDVFKLIKIDFSIPGVQQMSQ